MTYQEALNTCIFRYVSGSHAYGTAFPDSDKDVRGVFIAPLESAFNLFGATRIFNGEMFDQLQAARRLLEEGQLETLSSVLSTMSNPSMGDLKLSVETVHDTGVDAELQELRKFMKLAADCNPNIVEFLYVEQGIEHCTPQWEKIVEHRDWFLSKKAKFTFSGYAISQLRKIEKYREYLRTPPTHKPTLEEYDAVPNYPLNFCNAVMTLGQGRVPDSIWEVVKNTRDYYTALVEWNDYQCYLRNRNEKRAGYELKYGFDTKHAMHLIRLMRMAHEILKEGRVVVHRPDAEELMAIREGAWSYDRCVEHALELEAQLDPLYETSSLQHKPQHKKISDLYTEMCEDQYGIKIH